jgi:energy-coupling factor transporter ATP-binding protein EcfA2
MLIKSLSFIDKSSKWELKNVDFLNLTLLVGASGVGKTKILNSLNTLRNLALGEHVDRIKWNLNFEEQGISYFWVGEGDFDYSKENTVIFKGISSEEKVIVSYEKLSMVDDMGFEKVIFERSKDQILINGNAVPKITQSKSCIEIFSQEPDIGPVVNGFRKMYFYSFESERKLSFGTHDITLPDEEVIYEILKDDSQGLLESLKISNMPSIAKLAFVSKYFPDKFNEIKTLFLEIFPYVNDIRYTDVQSERKKEGEDNKQTNYELQIKENESDWIHKKDISSGMLKTLLYISTLQLIPEDSVVFIDEFENSLGINCIDILSSNASINFNTQFIITSHHPYIIGNISMDNWKIVSRHGGKVIAKDASDYDLGKSKHRAFTKLLNLTAYRKGREFF